MDHTFDKMFYNQGEHIGGIDEVGVSDIAGPLVAACVILPKIDLHRDNLKIFEVNDSKKIPEHYRKQHAQVVWEVAEAIGIGEVTPQEIDYFGRNAAIHLAKMRAVAACKSTSGKKKIYPDFILVDGRLRLRTAIRQKPIVDGDQKSLCIAAASIVAKVYRDEIMINLHYQCPWYDWINNKGYPSSSHFEGLDQKGIQIGLHRLKCWPFIPNHNVTGEAKEQWIQRIRRWKDITRERVGEELGDLWTTKARF